MKYAFNYARRIYNHVGVIQTLTRSTKSSAEKARSTMLENGWACWEIEKVKPQ